MKLGENSLFAEMQALKSQLSPNLSNADGITQQITANTSSVDFSYVLSQALGKVNQLQAQSAHFATQLELGNPNVTLSDSVIAREKASVAFEATMQVRNKLVDAYKEIMSMTV